MECFRLQNNDHPFRRSYDITRKAGRDDIDRIDYIEFEWDENMLDINITGCVTMFDHIKILILHLLSFYLKKYTKIQYQKNSLLHICVDPPQDAVSFFENIGFVNWESTYDLVKPYLDREWEYGIELD